MKNLLQPLVGLLMIGALVTQATAQCPSDTLLFEDFQTRMIPVTWSNLDLDSNTAAAAAPQAPDWFIRPDFVNTTPGDTNYVASAASWFAPSGRANNWLILDSINVCSPDVRLIWKSAPFEGPTFADGYKILISTTGDSINDFTDTIFIAAEDIAGAGVWGPGQRHSTFTGAGNNGVLQEWRLSLSAYAGQTIYVAFVHDSNDDSSILLDDIFIGITPANNLILQDIGGSPGYTMIPTTQVGPINYQGTVFNQYGPGANPKFQVRVTNMGMPVFADSALMAGTLPEEQDSTLVVTTAHTPAATIGMRMVMGWVTSDSVDVTPDDDTLRYSYMLTDTVYAREEGTATGNLSISPNNTGTIGQIFGIEQADDLTTVSYFRAGGRASGDSIRVIIYDMVGGQPTNVVATGDWVIDTDASPGWRQYNFGTSYVPLTPGSYLVAIEEGYSTRLQLGTNTNYFIPNTARVFLNGSWSNPEDFNFLLAFMIRPNFGIPLVVGVEQVEDPAVLKVFPQPARDWLTIEVEQPVEHITIYNAAGMVVRHLQTPTNLTLPVQDLAPGIYTLEVGQEGERLYSRFAKQ